MTQSPVLDAPPRTEPTPPPPPPGTPVRVKALRRFALSITVFTVLGHLVLGFEQAPITPIVTLLTAYAVELLFETVSSRLQGRTPGYAGGPGSLFTFLLPAHIGGLATAMLLYGNESLAPYLLAVSLGISLKYVVQVRVNGRRRHVLNPSNTGIALVLVLFPWVSIAPPYHFTNAVGGAVDWLIPLFILVAGTMLNAKLTGKWPLILGWVGGFVAQAAVRALLLDHSFVGALVPMTGVAFILYTNYMITDPGSTPFQRRNQVIFGVSVAAVYGVLVALHVSFGLFFALVLTCLGRGVVLVVADHRARHAREHEVTAPGLVPAMPGKATA